jgi:hypothetical protein
MHECRFYLDMFVPKEWHDRRGKFTIRRCKKSDDVALTVSITFEPC